MFVAHQDLIRRFKTRETRTLRGVMSLWEKVVREDCERGLWEKRTLEEDRERGTWKRLVKDVQLPSQYCESLYWCPLVYYWENTLSVHCLGLFLMRRKGCSSSTNVCQGQLATLISSTSQGLRNNRRVERKIMKGFYWLTRPEHVRILPCPQDPLKLSDNWCNKSSSCFSQGRDLSRLASADCYFHFYVRVCGRDASYSQRRQYQLKWSSRTSVCSLQIRPTVNI